MFGEAVYTSHAALRVLLELLTTFIVFWVLLGHRSSLLLIMNLKKSKFWPPFHIKHRHPGHWPLSEDVTTRICRYAGRQASAVLYIALYKNRVGGKDANAALRAVYYEPFTYWDWHGVDAEDESASKHKKQLVWERQRGFTAAKGEKGGYPYPQEAWQRFRHLIDNHAERRHWVAKIAVAHWMNIEDLTW